MVEEGRRDNSLVGKVCQYLVNVLDFLVRLQKHFTERLDASLKLGDLGQFLVNKEAFLLAD